MPGCSLCTKLAKLAFLGAMHQLRKAYPPSLTISIFVDDIPITATGERDAVIRMIGGATDVLTTALLPMGCEVAPDKTRIVASDAETARGLRRVVGAEDYEEQGRRATMLGADFAAGRRRGTWHRQSQARKRHQAAHKRKGRMIRMWQAGGARAHRVAQAGLLPQAGYGAEVIGVSNHELESLRRLQELGTGGKGEAGACTGRDSSMATRRWKCLSLPS